jgi:hypothetical protein
VTFQYKITDDQGADSNVATVSVEVNDAPVALDDGLSEVTIYATGATAIDGDFLSIGNTNFEIDIAGDGVAVGNVQVPVTSIDTAEVIATTIAAAINDPANAIPGVTATALLAPVENRPAVPPVVKITGANTGATDAVSDNDATAFIVGIQVYNVVEYSTVIDVLANDTDVDGTLNTSSVSKLPLPPPATPSVLLAPSHGEIVVNSDGSVGYQPDNGYFGRDSFEYTVKDDDGAISDPATVFLNVVVDPYPWHNRQNGADVNDDGFVSPIDALLIINELNRRGAIVPYVDVLGTPTTENKPPPFYDTNMNDDCEFIPDNKITPGDALTVINLLRPDSLCVPGEGEGESSISVDMTPSVASESLVAGESLVGPAVQVPESKVVDNGFTDMRNMRSSGLSTVRGQVLEDLLGEIAEDLMDAREDDLLVDIALDDFFG